MAESLESRLDRLNAVLGEVEQHLTSLRLHVTACVPMPKAKAFLIYGKSAGKWGLYVAETEDGQRAPLASLQIHVRIEGAELIPTLRAEMHRRHLASCEETERAADNLEAWLRSQKAGTLEVRHG